MGDIGTSNVAQFQLKKYDVKVEVFFVKNRFSVLQIIDRERQR